MVNHVVMRTLDQFGLHLDLANRWDGVMRAGAQPQVGAEELDESEKLR
jgi:hypothetical protein